MSNDNPPYPSWIYRQSAVLPYRKREDELEVLLISSRGGKRWVLPKGIVEPGMTPVASAMKEALEEAGVEGDVGREPLGAYRYRKWGGICEVTVYPYAVSNELENWPEAEWRRRRWRTQARCRRRKHRPSSLNPRVFSCCSATRSRAGPIPVLPTSTVHWRHGASGRAKPWGAIWRSPTFNRTSCCARPPCERCRRSRG